MRFREKIAFQQARWVLVTAFILGILLSSLQIAWDLRNEQEEINNTVNQVLGTVKASAAQAAYGLNNQLAQQVLNGLLEYRPVTSGAIFARIDNEIIEKLASIDRSHPQSELQWLANILVPQRKHYQVELLNPDNGQVIGELQVSIDPNVVAESFLDRLLLVVLTTIIWTVVISVLLLVLFYFSLTRALLQTADSLSAIDPANPGKSQIPTPYGHRSNEFGKLINDINRMLNRFGKAIEQRGEIENRLRESEEKFRTLFSKSPAAMSLKDSEGRFVMVNQAFEELYSKSASDVIGHESQLISGLPEPDKCRQMELAVLNENRTIDSELEYSIGNNQNKTILMVMFPINIVQGMPSYVGCISLDISARKNLERALRSAKEEAEFANRAKSTFLANMSHELRTPLNSIIGYSNLMQEQLFGTVSNPRYEEYIDYIHQSGVHLLEVINDILDLSKIEAGAMELSEETIDLTKLVDDCLRMVAAKAQAGNLKISNHVADDCPHLMGDKLRIKQILLNLLSNAIKFTPAGGEISIETEVKDGTISLNVTDTGIGISEGDLEKVLDPFVQVDDILSRSHEGSGLGLALVRNFMEQHHGSVRIESAIHQGTKVILSFPANRTITDQ
ncbi:PAS domain-containing sensor histidine kinase [Aestuariispira insulae]|uniref:histidine kinase n=1 Tax=Aestuariispira insulae TaxID=1461337 RepID=A0A3D9HVR1_9PROT|nr:ATP-binding protein [Aestuariispira insulae]RED53582.1 PAS domain S-box-containing protein [Aestuariispira insulae]